MQLIKLISKCSLSRRGINNFQFSGSNHMTLTVTPKTVGQLKNWYISDQGDLFASVP